MDFFFFKLFSIVASNLSSVKQTNKQYEYLIIYEKKKKK